MSGLRTWAWLGYRQQRRELWLVALGVAVAAGLMLWTAQSLDALRTGYPECGGAAPPAWCEGILSELSKQSMEAPRFLLLAFAAPFGMGVVLGAPLVAREIESGTAQLAWSLGRSRTGWLIWRAGFIVVIAVVGLALLAVGSEVLASAAAGGRGLDADFTWAGQRGWILVARGVGAMGIGVLVGALVGRVLPAMLAAAFVIGLAFYGMSVAHDGVLRAEAEILAPSDALSEGSLLLDSGVQLLSGEVLTWQQMLDRGYATMYGDEEGRQYASEEDLRAGREIGRDVFLAIPGERYTAVTAREAAASVGVGIIATIGAAAVVRRRRPT